MTRTIHPSSHESPSNVPLTSHRNWYRDYPFSNSIHYPRLDHLFSPFTPWSHESRAARVWVLGWWSIPRQTLGGGSKLNSLLGPSPCWLLEALLQPIFAYLFWSTAIPKTIVEQQEPSCGRPGNGKDWIPTDRPQRDGV